MMTGDPSLGTVGSLQTDRCGTDRRLVERFAPVMRYLQSLPGSQSVAAVLAGGQIIQKDRCEIAEPFRPAVARALTSGTLVTCRHRDRSWTIVGRHAPIPWALAVEGSVAEMDAASDVLRKLTEDVLPRLAASDPFVAIEASAPSLAPLLDELRLIATTPLPVLLLGETGTGKEVLARAIHRASPRPGKFVAENCAALPEGLLESELFGARRGAFTGADRDRVGRIRLADEGTLFLDEIGDLPAGLQAKLLRVIQEKGLRPLGSTRAEPTDLRIVAATHQPLLEQIEQGAFRADLYFRLAGFSARIAPLSERPSDIAPLCAVLLARLRDEGIGPGRFLSPGALAALAERRFPGNVRELDNVLRRAAALSPASVIRVEQLTFDDPVADPRQSNLEITMIERALAESRGVKAEAARRLGWTRQKLYRRLDRLGLG